MRSHKKTHLKIFVIILCLSSLIHDCVAQLPDIPMVKIDHLSENKCVQHTFVEAVLMGGFFTLGPFRYALEAQLGKLTCIQSLWFEVDPVYYEVHFPNEVDKECVSISITGYEELGIEEIARAIETDLGYLVTLSEVKTVEVLHSFIADIPIRSAEKLEYYHLESFELKDRLPLLTHIYPYEEHIASTSISLLPVLNDPTTTYKQKLELLSNRGYVTRKVMIKLQVLTLVEKP